MAITFDVDKLGMLLAKAISESMVSLSPPREGAVHRPASLAGSADGANTAVTPVEENGGLENVSEGERKSTSGASWADECAEEFEESVERFEEARAEVEGPQGCPSDVSYAGVVKSIAGVDASMAGVGAAVKGRSSGFESVGVKVPVGPRALVQEKKPLSFAATYYRTERMVGLRAALAKMCGHKVPSSADYSLALASFAAGAMPMDFVYGREKLRTLACVGDSALLTAALEVEYRCNRGMDSMQKFRSDNLTDKVLATAFVASPLIQYYSAGSVDVAGSKTGATAAEAFAGVLQIYVRGDSVLQFLATLRGLKL